jgi:hypothetical protein
MDDLEDYFGRLATWERLPMLPLVARWELADVNGIEEDFQEAYRLAGFAARFLEVEDDVSNQSIGNKVAEFFVEAVGRHLRSHRIEPCRGPGYPDKKLVRVADGRVFALEMKATSHFNRNDSNRIVLTCSSRKLRADFQAPINHALATVCYVKRGNQIAVEHLRLDFLDPDTPVDMRLEGSVSQKGLARGAQASITL